MKKVSGDSTLQKKKGKEAKRMDQAQQSSEQTQRHSYTCYTLVEMIEYGDIGLLRMSGYFLEKRDEWVIRVESRHDTPARYE